MNAYLTWLKIKVSQEKYPVAYFSALVRSLPQNEDFNVKAPLKKLKGS